MTAPFVARSMAGQRSAGTRPRASQFVITCGDTLMAEANSAVPPRMEIADLRAMQVLYTKCLRRSNALFETADKDSIHNLKMDLIKRIDAILTDREWGWADLARKMDLSEQRVNNWRTRGIPAAQVRKIETALGLKRYALDEEHTEADEATEAISEFAWLYRNVTSEGRGFLRDMLASVRRSFVPAERRTKSLTVVKDRRNKA